MQVQGTQQSLMMQNMMQSRQQETSLTDEQKSTIEDILSNFDLENMNEEDHMALGEALREAEIPPTEETMGLLQEAGLEPMQGMVPPPPPSTSMASMSEEEEEFFTTLIEQAQSGEISTEELLTQVEEYTGKTSGGMLDLGA